MADTRQGKYDHQAIEPKWQQYWLTNKTFRAVGPGEPGFDASKEKFYVLDMFPYPSGAGLHVGHPEGYTATDIVARYRRMCGFNVLHPMGYDAFGLPAEQYAVQTGTHPALTTRRNIENIRRQIQSLGFSYDWDRELATTDEKYYRWTQWIFLQLYKRGLAYLAEVPVNWCPELGTVLANEEVIDGKSERGGHPVVRMPLKQWMLKITAYADRLLDDLRLVDWPEPIKEMQRNWIGRSVGAEVDFAVLGRAGFQPAAGGIGGTGFQPVTGGIGGTGFQPVYAPSAEFTNAAKDDSYRPRLSAKDFVGRDPYPPGKPAPRELMTQIRNLPHCSLPGATYFVTINCQEGVRLDAAQKSAALNAILHWHRQRCIILAAVVLDDHAHLIVRPDADYSLSQYLHSIKRHSGHEIRTLLGGTGPVWQSESFDHIVRDADWLTEFIYYICENPIRRGFKGTFAEYPWLAVEREFVATRSAAMPFGNFGGDDRLETCATEVHRLETCATEVHRLETCPTKDDRLETYPTKDDRLETCPTKDDRLETCPTKDVIRIFTTRPDTLFGATYMVLAPEHPLVDKITSPELRPAVDAYRAEAARKSDLQRTALEKAKTGVFTGGYAINPVNNQPIPIWIADYVLMGYGTGAIMAVPAHDERDFEFAKKFDLPIPIVVAPLDLFSRDPKGSASPAQATECFPGEGVSVNSDNAETGFAITGLPTAEAKEKITQQLEAKGLGRKAVNYKLRDWLFSRQRYWGEPFPVIHCQTCGPQPLDEADLPVALPEVDEYRPTGRPEPLLARAVEWAKDVFCPNCGEPATRELNTMPQWAGSCWYYLRYLDPHNERQPWGQAKEKYWMTPNGVDLYVGGAEHAVLHLLYARFWHKVMFDAGLVSTAEPFCKLVNQGMILGEDNQKMSKSRGNVINPDDIIRQYGADSMRLYEMFMGPLEQSKPWSMRGVDGVRRFLDRVWRMIVDERTGEVKVPSAEGQVPNEKADNDTGNPALERSLHRTIKKVGEDIDAFKFNTAISAMMEFVNAVYAAGQPSPSQAERFVLILAPFAPHLAEELWQRLGHAESLAYEPWPTFDPALLVESTVEMPVQVNGKLRGKVVVPADADAATVEAAALAEPNVQAQLAGKTVRKVIVLPGKLVNIVAS